MKIDKILDLLYPKGLTCNVCGKELNDSEREFSICKKCEGSAKIIRANPVCYGKIPIYSHFQYDAWVRKYILWYKDSNKPFIAEYMAKYLFIIYKNNGVKANGVCFVPSSPKAIKRRGYDGMKLVAEEFCRLCGLPLYDTLFRRDGADQTKIDLKDRKKNVENKFLSRSGFTGDIILLDDVATTGSTLEACAETVMSHGARSVIALTFARA